MTGFDPRLDRASTRAPSRPPWQRALWWLVAATAVTTAFVILAIVPHWLYLGAPSARDLGRFVTIAFTDALVAAYGVAVVGALITAVALALGYAGLRWPWTAASVRTPLLRRLGLLSFSLWLSLVLLESGAWAWSRWLHRRPQLPVVSKSNDGMDHDLAETPLTSQEHPRLPTQFQNPSTAEAVSTQAIRLLVIGESSGRGEPYHPWLSAGQIVAWRLKSVFPGRQVELDMWAKGGATLEMMHNELASLTYRPDALLVYVGHNEFAARYPWMRQFDYYLDDQPQSAVAAGLERLTAVAHFSPLCRLALETRERQQVGIQPKHVITRELIDRPVCTKEEAEAIGLDFLRRLEAIAAYCDTIGTVPVFVVPPCNDSGFDPNRSVLAPRMSKAERVAFARSVARARAREAKEPEAVIGLYRELIGQHPEFAELHYRLARLLEQAGKWDEARMHYIQARELDAMPLRCPERLRQAIRQVASAHPSVLLVDGPELFASRSAHGLVGDAFFHDAQHPNLRGYAILAEEILHQLAGRRTFGWPEGVAAPLVDLEACARHFQIDAARWEEVCRREAWFFEATAYIRYDPRFRTERAKAYLRAAAAIHSGCEPAAALIPGWPLPPKPASSRRIPNRVR